jgi:hypothetical protein
LCVFLGLEGIEVVGGVEVFVEDGECEEEDFLAQTFEGLFELIKQSNILPSDPLEGLGGVLLVNFIADRHKNYYNCHITHFS